MIAQNFNSSQSNEEDVIVWMPFVVKMKHLQSPLMAPMTPPQPIPVQPVQQAETPTLLPPIASTSHAEQKPRVGMASDKQKNFIMELVTKLNMTEAEMQKELGVRDLEQATNEKANEFIQKYKKAKPQF